VAVFDPKSLASGVYNPVAAPNQNLKPSTSVAMASPGIYAAAMKTGLTSDESTVIESWSVIHNKHKQLMSMGNAQADAAYQKLDENTRGLLDAYYGVNYGRRPEGGVFSTAIGNEILGGQGNDGYSIGDLVKSPFRALFAAGEAYGRAVNAPGREIQLAATGQEVKLNEAFSNEAIFNPEYTEPLIQKYGLQRSHVATSLLKGMTPGEIIESWGPNDADMLMAVGEIFDNTPEFNTMLEEFSRAQLSPGRTIAFDVNKKLNIKAEDHPWLFNIGSGSIDLAYQIFADPMTYATGGLGLIPKGIGKTKNVTNLLKGGTRSITEPFAQPGVSELWTGLSKGLAEYGDAVKAKDLTKAAEIRTTLKNQYPDYANDGTIELFSKGKFDPLTNQTVGPIRDLDSAKAFFEAANMTSKIMRGRVSGIKFQQDGIPIMQRSRNIKTGIRLKTREFLKGKDSFDALGEGDIEKLADEFANAGAYTDGNYDFTAINEIIDRNKKKGLNGWIDRMSARHPGNKEIYNPTPVVSLDHKEVAATSVDLWASFDRTTGHHFNLSIDLNACTGCGACVIACHAENNVPVVGKTEIRRSRDMHWLRIDRYYSSEETFAGDITTKNSSEGLTGTISTFQELEDPSANPQVVFQPVMCQHCNHAPCETVCPVAATSHSRQGQNHMAYNRCVGTRYCANNCPYKVRRFNWFLYNKNDEFDYHMNDDLGRMVLNPDVNVRSRGVMEKCSMCIQMTQATILKAKKEGKEVGKDDFQTACSAACTSGAMIFGDVNNKESDVAQLLEDDRMYHLLESIGTKPNVMYHVKVRNDK
jgi:Fe-S-cluster-containing dehydrogenase component